MAHRERERQVTVTKQREREVRADERSEVRGQADRRRDSSELTGTEASVTASKGREGKVRAGRESTKVRETPCRSEQPAGARVDRVCRGRERSQPGGCVR